MGTMIDNLSVYRELADTYERLGQVSMRDRFLILAADAAFQAGQAAEAERLRQRLLQGNRHHLLRPFASFAEATAEPGVQSYLGDLRVNYPPETARELLESLQSPGESALDHTPAPSGRFDRPAAVPPTAPLMDMHGGGAGGRGMASPYPLSQPADQRASGAHHAPHRPLAQPLAGRSVPAQGAVPTASPVPARTMPAGRTANATGPIPVAGATAAPAQARQPVPGSGENGAVWLSDILFVLASLVALAVAAFTLARPWLPVDWMPWLN